MNNDRVAAACRLLERIGIPDERHAPVCRVELHYKHDRVVAQVTRIEASQRVESVIAERFASVPDSC